MASRTGGTTRKEFQVGVGRQGVQVICRLFLLELVGVLTEKNWVRMEERWTIQNKSHFFLHSFTSPSLSSCS